MSNLRNKFKFNLTLENAWGERIVTLFYIILTSSILFVFQLNNVVKIPWNYDNLQNSNQFTQLK